MESNVTLFAGFIAGVLTFISPCVLPLIPAYISYITGASIDELKNQNKNKTLKPVILKTLAFVSGFSIVFTALGVAVNYVGGFFDSIKYFRFAGGILVILFGLHLTGIVKFKFLYKQAKLEVKNNASGYAAAMFIGMAFAFAWTPCVGPVLASILMLASTETTAMRGAALLLSYSLGIGAPFVLTAIFINSFFSFFDAVKKYFRVIEIAAGIMLLVIGVLIITGGFNWITIQILKAVT